MSDFMNISVAQINKIAETLDIICKRPEMISTTFTTKQFNTIRNSSWQTRNAMCTLETLRKYGFVSVAKVIDYNVYVRIDKWDNEVIDMTDEQYEMLPECFKAEVRKESRRKYLYVINIMQATNFIEATAQLVHFMHEYL